MVALSHVFGLFCFILKGHLNDKDQMSGIEVPEQQKGLLRGKFYHDR